MSRYLVKHFWVCLWDYFWKSLASELVNWVKIFLPSVGGHRPSCLEQTCRGRAKSLSLPELRHPSFPALRYQTLVFLVQGLSNSPGHAPSAPPHFPPIPRPLNSDWITASGFPGPPACWQETLGLLGHYDHSSQLL